MGMGMALIRLRCDTIRHDQEHHSCSFLSCRIGMNGMVLYDQYDLDHQWCWMMDDG